MAESLRVDPEAVLAALPKLPQGCRWEVAWHNKRCFNLFFHGCLLAWVQTERFGEKWWYGVEGSCMGPYTYTNASAAGTDLLRRLDIPAGPTDAELLLWAKMRNRLNRASAFVGEDEHEEFWWLFMPAWTVETQENRKALAVVLKTRDPKEYPTALAPEARPVLLEAWRLDNRQGEG